MTKSKLHYNLIFRQELEGGFTVIVPTLPGCISYGRTLVEAKKMAADAIAGYIESLKKHKEAVNLYLEDVPVTQKKEISARHPS